MNRNGIFGPKSSPDKRLLSDLDAVKEMVEHIKGIEQKIVLTSGSYDMIHIGHARYLENARSHGDFLLVGVDSDEKARKRKGEYRPVVPQEERIEMLCHLRSVDALVVKDSKWPKFALIKAVKPDVLILVEGTYPDGIPSEIEEACVRIEVLPRQAETSTSAKIRRLLTGGMDNFKKAFLRRAPEFLDQCREESLEKE